MKYKYKTESYLLHWELRDVVSITYVWVSGWSPGEREEYSFLNRNIHEIPHTYSIRVNIKGATERWRIDKTFRFDNIHWWKVDVAKGWNAVKMAGYDAYDTDHVVSYVFTPYWRFWYRHKDLGLSLEELMRIWIESEYRERVLSFLTDWALWKLDQAYKEDPEWQLLKVEAKTRRLDELLGVEMEADMGVEVERRERISQVENKEEEVKKALAPLRTPILDFRFRPLDYWNFQLKEFGVK
jgi:hypothetical protein